MSLGGVDQAPNGNPIRQRLALGENLVGGWCTLPTSFAAELVCHAGVDYAVIDMQHGLTGYSDLIAMLQAIGSTGVTPLVRIPFQDYGLAQRALDAGAYGLVFPMISTRELALEAVNSCRYPPMGERSYGPIRSRMFLGTDPNLVNQEVLCLVQIETRLAMENLEDILTTDGVDGVYVGPADLALSHQLPIGEATEEHDDMLRLIAEKCRTLGRIPGIHMTSGQEARKAFSLGYVMCSVGSDAVWLRAGYASQIAEAKSTSSRSEGGFY